jgi:TonB family protein
MRFFVAVVAFQAFLAAAFGQPPADQSIEKYKRFLEINPQSSLAHFRIGESLMLQQNYPAAASEFSLALHGDLDPGWTVAWSHINLGKIFDLMHQCDRAISEYVLAAETNDNTNFALNEANAYLRANSIQIISKQPESADNAGLLDGVHGLESGVVWPAPIQKIQPEYSEEGRIAGLEGTVWVSAIIGEDGTARDVHVTRSLGLGLDEKAMEAVQKARFRPGSYAGSPAPVRTALAVDFLMPSKQSRWHLFGAEFQAPEGASRPVFRSTVYPPGAGVGKEALDEAKLVGMLKRLAWAKVSFDVNEQGVPVHLQVVDASLDVWGPESVALVSTWRFKPGQKDRVSVSIPATLYVAWGSKTVDSGGLAQLWKNMKPATPEMSSRNTCRATEAVEVSKLDWPPPYTEEARKAKLQGEIAVSFVVAEDGHTKDVRVIKSLGSGLDEKAIEAVSKWRFWPQLMNGQPVQSAPTMVMLPFRLPDH